MTTALDAGPATTNESTMDGRRFQLRFSVQAFVWLLVTILALATIALNFGDLKASIQVLKGAQLGYLPVLALLEALFLLNMGLFYTATFRASNVHASAPRFVLVSAGAHFVNLVSKSSGFGGLALYLNEGRCHGDSSANVTGAYVAAYVLSYAGFLVTLILALALLQLRGSLTLVEKASSGVLFLIVITIVAASVAGLRNRRSLAQVCRRLTAIPNWAGKQFLRRPLFATEQVEAWAEELYDSFRLMRTRPAAFITPFMHALGIELLAASSLYFLGLALNTGMSFETALAAYALSVLFAILSVTPAGLGFVEASMVIFLISTGMPRQEAVAVTVAYRLVDFWLPVVIGGLSLLSLRLSRPTAKVPA